MIILKKRLPIVWCFLLFIVLLLSQTFKQKTRASSLGLPEPQVMLSEGRVFEDALLRGIAVDPKNPFNLRLYIDSGNKTKVSNDDVNLLVNYFLTALAVLDNDMWVNLSPYEGDRILPDTMAQTKLGMELLKQDYLLKQMASSLTHPDIRSKGVLNLNKKTESFNKVWIVPGQISIVQNRNKVFIKKSSLNVLGESDYLAHKINNNDFSIKKLLGDSVMSSLTKAVNNSEHFSSLRQVYSAVILAGWFKDNYSNTVYSDYIDKYKMAGLKRKSNDIRLKVHDLYKESFDKGVYDVFIKDKEAKVARRYLSGGVNISSPIKNFDVSRNLTESEWKNIIKGNVRVAEIMLRQAYSAEKTFHDLGDAEIEQGQSYVVFDFGEYVLKVPKYKREFADFKERFVRMQKSLGGLAARTMLLDSVHLKINGEEYFFDGAFIQDKVVPLSKVFKEKPLETNKRILDEVITLGKEMCSRGWHNLDHKINMAYGLTAGGKVVIFDLNHVYDTKENFYMKLNDDDWNMNLYNMGSLTSIDRKLAVYYSGRDLSEAEFDKLWLSGRYKRRVLRGPTTKESISAMESEDSYHPFLSRMATWNNLDFSEIIPIKLESFQILKDYFGNGMKDVQQLYDQLVEQGNDSESVAEFIYPVYTMLHLELAKYIDRTWRKTFVDYLEAEIDIDTATDRMVAAGLTKRSKARWFLNYYWFHFSPLLLVDDGATSPSIDNSSSSLSKGGVDLSGVFQTNRKKSLNKTTISNSSGFLGYSYEILSLQDIEYEDISIESAS